MGVQIRTIVHDNVARRCDGCLDIIDGTPWRVNLLDIVASESPVAWTERPDHQPGSVPVPRRPGLRAALDGREGLPLLPPGRGPRDHAARRHPRRDRPMGPVRRHPSRRSRVRPGLIRAVRRARIRGRGDRLTRPERHAYPPPAGPFERYPALPTFHRNPRLRVTSEPTPDGPVPWSAPTWLSIGPASRLLGVDQDTLRRWADEGRIDAFTTPGGHRRFERAAVDRLVAGRRAGARPLASMGATPERLSRVYQRSYVATDALRRPGPQRRRRRRPRDLPPGRPPAGHGAGGPPRCRSAGHRRAQTIRGPGDRTRGRPGPATRGRRHQPDRVRRPVRRGPPPVPGRAGRVWAAAARWTRLGWPPCTRTPRACSTGCCCG